MALGVVLTIVSGVSSAAELVTNYKHQAEIHALKMKLGNAEAEAERLRDASKGQQEAGGLTQKLAAAEAEIKRLRHEAESQEDVVQLKQKLSDAQKTLAQIEQTNNLQQTVLAGLVADQLQIDLKRTEGKASSLPQSDEPKVRRLLLRRAVFVNMSVFGADETILRHGLQQLVKRGFSDLAPAIDDVVAELPALKASKLRWLEDAAIPALEEDARKLQHSAAQRGPRAEVALPETFIIDADRLDVPKVTVTDLVALQSEVILLKKSV
jgi:hypothetical protein